MDFDLSVYSHLPQEAQNNLIESLTAKYCVTSDIYGYYRVEERTKADTSRIVQYGALSDEIITELNCDNAKRLTSYHNCYCGKHN
jgi:hypothetical protein